MEIRVVDWSEGKSALTNIRQKVFIEEQQVPSDLEWDNEDSGATHFLGKEGNRPVACARLLKDGKLGRVAVLKDYRAHGWGSRLLRAAEAYLKDLKRNRIYLDAQAASYMFYFENGYRPETEMFWDANIPHIRMSKVLNRPASASQQYILGQDEKLHKSEQPAASAVWFQLASNLAHREIHIRLNDEAHPLFNNTACISSLSRFLLSSHQSQIKLLLSREIPGISEHPLLQLQQRTSSRFKVKVSEQNASNHITFDLKGYMEFDYRSSRCCFNNRLSVTKQRESFMQLWEQAQLAKEAKRLHI